MQWEYTETLSKKDLIQILHGMADSLEKKGFLEAWIGNTKINVEVGDIFILETTFNQDTEKSEVNFSLNLSWIPEEEKFVAKPAKPKKKAVKEEKPAKTIAKKEAVQPAKKQVSPETIPVPEMKAEKVGAKPGDISSIPKPVHGIGAPVGEPPRPSISASTATPEKEIKTTPKQHIPISPKADIISDEIPVPPTDSEIKGDWRKDFDKEIAEIGLPTPEPPSPPTREAKSLEVEKEPQLVTIAAGGGREYVSAFNWASSREWMDVSIQKDVSIPQDSGDSTEEAEEDIFKELDEE